MWVGIQQLPSSSLDRVVVVSRSRRRLSVGGVAGSLPKNFSLPRGFWIPTQRGAVNSLPSVSVSLPALLNPHPLVAESTPHQLPDPYWSCRFLNGTCRFPTPPVAKTRDHALLDPYPPLAITRDHALSDPYPPVADLHRAFSDLGWPLAGPRPTDCRFRDGPAGPRPALRISPTHRVLVPYHSLPSPYPQLAVFRAGSLPTSCWIQLPPSAFPYPRVSLPYPSRVDWCRSHTCRTESRRSGFS